MQVHSAPATEHANGESPLHERDALSVRGIMWFAVMLVLITAFVMLVVWWMYVAFVRADVRSDVVNSALAGAPRSVPAPLLQPSPGHDNLPSQDMAALLKRENDEFIRRGWMSRSNDQVEIPSDVVEKVTQLSAPAGGAR